MGVLAGWPLASGLLRRPLPPPAILGTLPDFALTAPNGARLDNASLAGRVWLVGFVDAGCAACVEGLSGALEHLQHRLRNAGPAVGMLQVLLEGREPVFSLEQELARRHANPRLWWTAQGPKAARLLLDVEALAPRQADGLGAGRALLLVDGRGRIRAVEAIETEEGVNRLLSQLTLLLNLGSSSS